MNGLITISAIVYNVIAISSTATGNKTSTSTTTSKNTSISSSNTTTTTSITLQTTFTSNTAFDNILPISIEETDFRRQDRGIRRKRRRSTSSSSGVKVASKQKAASAKKESLEMTEGSSIEYSHKKKASSVRHNKKMKLGTVSSEEYQDGWRKWHRRCYRCPEMDIKYREPTLKWICGAYQRARRSFKSLCMMHYRNCQDGTMFVKIADHKCLNTEDDKDLPHGRHFFYEYKAILDSETTVSAKSDSASSASSVSNTFSITLEDEERKRNAFKKMF